MHALALRPAPQLLEVPIEALDFSEESDVERELIEHAHRVMRIGSGHESILGLGNRAEMPRRNEPGNTCDCEVFHDASSAPPSIGAKGYHAGTSVANAGRPLGMLG
jgi:hypothetical protein